MSIREDRDFLRELRAERESIRENAIKQDREAFNQRIIDRDDAVASHEAALDRFYNYKDDVKKTLLKEALMKIYEGSFHNITDREHVLCEALLEQYIQDTGTTQLLKNMKFSDSFLLRKIHEEVIDFASDITAGATADNPDSQVIDPTKVDSFWKEIDKSEDIEDITNLIRMRVSNAEEDFINKNQEDKEDIKTVLKQTASRVQAAKGSNDNDYSEAVEESETRLAKDNIYKIQHESHHNVFDRMVRNLSEVALTNEEAKKEFLAENGHLDVEKIVESVRCMYTLLEMVGTIQLEKVDQQYIEDTLKSIK